MLFTITHHGVPIGTVELTRADTSAAEQIACAVSPLPAYAPVQPIVRAASEALRNLLPAGPPAEPRTTLAAERALGRGAELGRELELRDATGLLVATDFIELSEWRGGNPEVTALIRFRLSHTAVPARPAAARVRRHRRPGACGITISCT